MTVFAGPMPVHNHIQNNFQTNITVYSKQEKILKKEILKIKFNLCFFPIFALFVKKTKCNASKNLHYTVCFSFYLDTLT